ncbi:hypothetical protein [Limnoglobus roseus]|uniref:Uncharacterized protein n=1 Tax=Limnoglobus roseus TaxID=2598579 RepID=A0A5C1AJX0_9BACT|nr:hypothetical protein [Limnoglobus roseus]QEL17992.1 hypothetical protein PX52LOC_05006 [Limnoglobus roseus]
MTDADLTMEQAVVVRMAMSPKIVARSAEIDFAAEEAIFSIAVKFGRRPAGVACPAAVFAYGIDRNRVAVVQVADRTDGSDDPPLAFHFLLLSRKVYAELGDPFAIADRYPANFDARGSLAQLAWPPEPLPRRSVVELRAMLKAGDSQWLLGATQALLDGAHVSLERLAPEPARVRGLWQMIPDRIRCDLWPTTFAFGGDLNFHVAVTPTAVPGHLSEEQTKDYPEGRYESAIQVAIETSDQAELDRLLARRPSAEMLRLAVAMILFAFAVAAVLKFL